MKKQTVVTIGLIITAVFLLGMWYGKTQAKNMQLASLQSDTPDYLYLNDFDTMVKDGSDFLPHPKEIPKENVSPELKKFFLQEEYASYQTTNSCMKDNASCTTDNVDLQVEEWDLDEDGTKEYIVSPWKICDCMMRGATANGDILVVKHNDDGFKIIGHLTGNRFGVSKNTTDTYHDIVTNDHSSAGSGTETIYKFQPFVSGDTANGSYTEYLSKAYDFSLVKQQQ